MPIERRYLAVATLSLLASAACAPVDTIDAPSRNQNSRVNYLVIHFTTENFADSLALLTEPSDNPVSAHYLIPEPDDPTYERPSLRIYHLVDESRRAWHAGRSYWNGEEALNDRSIGIELVNRSYCVDEPGAEPDPERRFCFYPDFSQRQIDLLIGLATDILARHPEIDPVDVVGHADVAPERKVDPGPRFPWQLLHQAGIGAWYEDEAVLRYWDRFRDALPPLETLQRALSVYGYPIDVNGTDDAQSRAAIRAFQMHFRPSVVSGAFDVESTAILFALIERYRGESLGPLLEEVGRGDSMPHSSDDEREIKVTVP